MSLFALMAGGTGGHLFPAEALAEELVRRGHRAHLITDRRSARFGGDFPAEAIHVISAATPSVRNPVKAVRAGAVLAGGLFSAWRILRKINADAVVGFGGYPTFSPFLAASLMGIPGVLHEANGVLGRANRALARFSDTIALGFENTAYADRYRVPLVVTGNPVRDRVVAQRGVAYPETGPATPIRILVFGGSQGARFFADVVPPAIMALPEEMRERLDIVQQCRPEDLDRVTAAYATARVNVELAEFFADLPERMAQSHLVVSRSGASTVAELAVIGRPAILVPLPGALDNDQRANATEMVRAGGALMLLQDNLSPNSLASELAGLFASPPILPSMAARAHKSGRPDAVARLAEVAIKVASGATDKAD
jgi:UDP-N-acetylglucosamine--N-acetylmuramyl-(pentapeptide) pyrophosphoryl-undecaprenol N-acetylglucosamine transferase